MTLVLDIRFEGVDAPVGKLARLDSGASSFRYAPDYLALSNALPVSMSLPLRAEPFGDVETRAVFSNLLHENDLLEQVQARHGLARDDFVALLFHLGGDCPGALSCVPEGAPAIKTPGLLSADYDLLPPETVNDIAARLARKEPLPEEAQDPSPIAGVQRKIALVLTPDGRFALPKKGLRVPTTHILKVPPQREADLEAAAARLALSCGLDAVLPEVRDLSGVRALLLPRFDRRLDDAGRVFRIHQEDFAQALGLPSHLKYERHGERPRVFDTAAIATVLDRTALPALARRDFILSVFFNLAIGNTDNHAKNYALLYDAGGPAPRLAPLYDLQPVRLNANYTHTLAFRLGGCEDAAQLDLEAFRRLLLVFGLRRAAATRFVKNDIATLLLTIDKGLDSELKGLKDFADLAGGEIRRVANALELDLPLQPRDHFAARAGGWAAS